MANPTEIKTTQTTTRLKNYFKPYKRLAVYKSIVPLALVIFGTLILWLFYVIFSLKQYGDRIPRNAAFAGALSTCFIVTAGAILLGRRIISIKTAHEDQWAEEDLKQEIPAPHSTDPNDHE